MQEMNDYLKRLFNPRIEPCFSPYGDYKVQLSETHTEYFWLRKDAREFIKNFTKEI